MHWIRAILAVIIMFIDLVKDFVERRQYENFVEHHRKAARERNMVQYRKEFEQLFPFIMAKLVDERRKQLPCLKDAYNHLEKVSPDLIGP